MYLGPPDVSCSGSTPSSREVTNAVPSDEAATEMDVSMFPGSSSAGGSSYSACPWWSSRWSSSCCSPTLASSGSGRTSAREGPSPPCSCPWWSSPWSFLCSWSLPFGTSEQDPSWTWAKYGLGSSGSSGAGNPETSSSTWTPREPTSLKTTLPLTPESPTGLSPASANASPTSVPTMVVSLAGGSVVPLPSAPAPRSLALALPPASAHPASSTQERTTASGSHATAILLTLLLCISFSSNWAGSGPLCLFATRLIRPHQTSGASAHLRSGGTVLQHAHLVTLQPDVHPGLVVGPADLREPVLRVSHGQHPVLAVRQSRDVYVLAHRGGRVDVAPAPREPNLHREGVRLVVGAARAVLRRGRHARGRVARRVGYEPLYVVIEAEALLGPSAKVGGGAGGPYRVALEVLDVPVIVAVSRVVDGRGGAHVARPSRIIEDALGDRHVGVGGVWARAVQLEGTGTYVHDTSREAQQLLAVRSVLYGQVAEGSHAEVGQLVGGGSHGLVRRY